MTDRKAITVYVRLGPGDNDAQRTVSFRRPTEIPTSVLLDKGFAIDGNEAVVCVMPRLDAGNFIPLMEALLDEEKALVAWLDEYGYDVEFK
jgi:hypothetical protein